MNVEPVMRMADHTENVTGQSFEELPRNGGGLIRSWGELEARGLPTSELCLSMNRLPCPARKRLIIFTIIVGINLRRISSIAHGLWPGRSLLWFAGGLLRLLGRFLESERHFRGIVQRTLRLVVAVLRGLVLIHPHHNQIRSLHKRSVKLAAMKRVTSELEKKLWVITLTQHTWCSFCRVYQLDCQEWALRS